jgi:hypothetical protein
MATIDYSSEIEKMMWADKKFADAPSLYSLGVKNEDRPIVFQCRDLTIVISNIRRNCRVYLSILKKGNSIDGFWATHNDLPKSALKDLYKIVKKLS